MKIAICGSMHFAKEMLRAKEQLEKMGHKTVLPEDVYLCLGKPDLNMDLKHCLETDIQKKCFDGVAESDAILVLNIDKNGIKNYIGGATLMEIGLAMHLNKKVFLLNPPPETKDLRYVHEVLLARPIILNGDLNKINHYES
jgi:nucleoside 2-deoxyribosyltransferase